MSGGKQLDILVFNSVGNTGVPSFLDHIGMFARHSKHRCFYHNFVYQFDPDMDFSKFDVVVFTHNFWLPALTQAQRTAIRNIKALKVLFLQDEFQYLRDFNRIMNEMGIEIMFTCAAERDFKKFYPRNRIRSLKEIHQNLTGYVTDNLRKPGMRARGRRRWDVGYRGRPPIYYMGLLGQHKIRIAHEFTAMCEREGLSHNISYQEDDRLSGKQWFDFLRSTRVQLGSPSGTSIVDLDGSLIEAEQKYRAAKPHSTFEEVFEAVLKPHEGKMKIDTVSPRHFEYAATGATMAMVEGHYGGYLTAGEHYIPIAPDYSNLDQVIAQIRDRDACRQIANHAHAHLIESGDFSAEKFVERFDVIIELHAKPKTSGERLSQDAFDAMMAERFNQALFFRRNGPEHIPSPEGRRIRQAQMKSRLLTGSPVIGPILRRTGGDPLMKAAKGRAALRLAAGIAGFRPLVAAWARHPEHRFEQNILFADLLKSILLLGLVKAAQSGAAPYGEGFHTQIRLDRDTVILDGSPADAGSVAKDESSGWSQAVDDALGAGLDGDIRIDLSKRWPILLFGHSTQVIWSVADKVAIFRSSSDEYFHLTALTKVAAFAPKIVAEALRCALRPARGAEIPVIERAFNVTLPDAVKEIAATS
jgi:hypothetical protein